MNLAISGNEAKEQLAISKNETKFNHRAKLRCLMQGYTVI